MGKNPRILLGGSKSMREGAPDTEAKSADALKSKDMLSDLEYSYSPVRDKVRDLREYL
jgi:hypothetical protein